MSFKNKELISELDCRIKELTNMMISTCAEILINNKGDVLWFDNLISTIRREVAIKYTDSQLKKK